MLCQLLLVSTQNLNPFGCGICHVKITSLILRNPYLYESKTIMIMQVQMSQLVQTNASSFILTVTLLPLNKFNINCHDYPSYNI